MLVRRARARNFRLLADFSVELHPELNFVVGGNGAGKTTVLEALYTLGRAGSYRSSGASLSTEGQAAWMLDASIGTQDALAPDRAIRVRYADRQVVVEIDRSPAAVIDLVRLMPVLIIDPLAHRLIEEGPGIRRRFLDWGVFHMEQGFLETWKRMNRALRQRNAGLRQQLAPPELLGWNRELAGAAESLTGMRQSYVEQLQRAVEPYWQRLLGNADWRLQLQRGWRQQEYGQLLAESYESDRRAGHTREGPHRAELQILSDNRSLKERVSRGQQKLLIAGLVLAQSDLYEQYAAARPLLLVDDFSAELSQDSQRRFFDVLKDSPGQKVIAALEYSELFRAVAGQSVFHVEHGQVTSNA